MPPAARLGDLHTCFQPPHPPTTIAGPCEPTVLIGGQPAARVSDVAGCGAAISMGSPTVKIGGKDAARLGDPTDHPGIIDQGCPTVLIGIPGKGECLGKAAKSGAMAVSGAVISKPPPGTTYHNTGTPTR